MTRYYRFVLATGFSEDVDYNMFSRVTNQNGSIRRRYIETELQDTKYPDEEDYFTAICVMCVTNEEPCNG